MLARDIYHDAVKKALIKDGWTITDDPLRLIGFDPDEETITSWGP